MSVALVGRPNVGKSTLFNRLIGGRQAIVAPEAGTTRDGLIGSTTWRGRTLTIVDTAGVLLAPSPGLDTAIQRHLVATLQSADVIVLIGDGGRGLLPLDQEVLDRLRRLNRPIILAVNKLDRSQAVPSEWYEPGIEPVVGISGLHGRGIGELLDAIVERLAPDPSVSAERPGADASTDVVIAVVGRPNAGKSCLVNALASRERAIVSEAPGTTRDAVETLLEARGRRVRLIDTAGLRHRSKVRAPVEVFSMARTRAAIGRCDVAILVLDASLGVTKDDRRIASLLQDAGCGWVVAVNKWDLLQDRAARAASPRLTRGLPQAAGVPAVATSAITGFQVARILEAAMRAANIMRRPLSEAVCTGLVNPLWVAHPVVRRRGRPIHLRAARWIPGRPVYIALATDPPGLLPPKFQAYLTNRLRAHPRLQGAAIRLMRQSGPPPK